MQERKLIGKDCDTGKTEGRRGGMADSITGLKDIDLMLPRRYWRTEEFEKAAVHGSQ